MVDTEFKPRLIGRSISGNSFINQLRNLDDIESKKVKDRQVKQFSLGNDNISESPLETAKMLLGREYGDSFLFKLEEHAPVFIPPIFPSKAYKKKVLGDLGLSLIHI